MDNDTAERTLRAAAEHQDPSIPGAREPDTLTHREPGAIGGQFTGADVPAQPVEWLDRETAAEQARGGGETRRHQEKDEEAGKKSG